MSRRPLRLSAALLGAAALAAGCKREPNAFVPPPPPEVTVAHPEARRVPQTLEYTGWTRAAQSVEIRARVRGFIQQRFVEGGETVDEGDVLFVIDPREYDAAVKQAKAEVAAKQANLRLADVTLERVTTAIQSRAASVQEMDQATAARDAAQAAVDLALAQLQRAELDKEFTQVVSPVRGRVGARVIDLGTLVSASEPTLLATVNDVSTIYATYTIDEALLLKRLGHYQGGEPGEGGRPELEVSMQLPGETGFPHVGRFVRADNTVDPNTGTITIEAEFKNQDLRIVPGLFVRIRTLLEEEEAVLVPDVAVGADQAGRYVLVVNAEDVVERRNVEVGPVIDRMRVVRRPAAEGTGGDAGPERDAGRAPVLAASDRVVVNGIQRARPGSKVSPRQQSVAAATAPPSPAATP